VEAERNGSEYELLKMKRPEMRERNTLSEMSLFRLATGKTVHPAHFSGHECLSSFCMTLGSQTSVTIGIYNSQMIQMIQRIRRIQRIHLLTQLGGDIPIMVPVVDHVVTIGQRSVACGEPSRVNLYPYLDSYRE